MHSKYNLLNSSITDLKIDNKIKKSLSRSKRNIIFACIGIYFAYKVTHQRKIIISTLFYMILFLLIVQDDNIFRVEQGAIIIF